MCSRLSAGGHMQSASYFRQKAEQCRRVAASVLTHNDVTAASLTALAAEFDAAAAVIDGRSASAELIGYGDDLPPDRARIASIRMGTPVQSN